MRTGSRPGTRRSRPRCRAGSDGMRRTWPRTASWRCATAPSSAGRPSRRSRIAASTGAWSRTASTWTRACADGVSAACCSSSSSPPRRRPGSGRSRRGSSPRTRPASVCTSGSASRSSAAANASGSSTAPGGTCSCSSGEARSSARHERPLRLRPERRPLADRGGALRPRRRGRARGSFRRLEPGAPGAPGGGGGDVRARRRPLRPGSAPARARRCGVGRRRRDDGLRRRLPVPPGQAVRRLAARGPPRPAARARPRDPRRDRPAGPRARRGARRRRRPERRPMTVAEHRPPPAVVVPVEEAAVLKKLSTLDRFLPLWIGLAMAAGLGLGRLIPSLNDGLNKLQVGTVSLPIALGLLLMMYPVLAKVRYEELGRARHDGVSNRVFFGWSLFLSWIVGPLLMFGLAWLLLADQPAYRTGVIIVGLARCIAMVLIWNDIAQGDRDRTALLVVFNAIFQVAAYAVLGWFYLSVLPGWLGLDTQGFEVGIWEVAKTVLIFLGIPLAAGLLTRWIGIERKGREWYEAKLIPRISPITLYGLLFTIVLLFAIQGDKITSRPGDVARIALPLLAYFA